jgi:hypothetical protein
MLQPFHPSGSAYIKATYAFHRLVKHYFGRRPFDDAPTACIRCTAGIAEHELANFRLFGLCTGCIAAVAHDR